MKVEGSDISKYALINNNNKIALVEVIKITIFISF